MGAILWTWKRLHPGAVSAPLFSFSEEKDPTEDNAYIWFQSETIQRLAEENEYLKNNISSMASDLQEFKSRMQQGGFKIHTY